MRRLAVVTTIALACALAPAHAGQTDGTITVATFGSPGPARLAYANEALPNGVLGWVFRVGLQTTRFTLAKTAGPTGLEDFDIFFYASLADVAVEPLGTFANEGNESGAIPAGAVWAVVTLAAGAQGSFRYSAT